MWEVVNRVVFLTSFANKRNTEKSRWLLLDGLWMAWFLVARTGGLQPPDAETQSFRARGDSVAF